MNIEDWKNVLIQILDENEIDTVLNDFVLKHRLDPNKFEANVERLTLKPSIASFWGVKRLTPTPSMNYFNLGRIARAFPLWFYAAFPDVMMWFHEYQKIILSANNYDDEIVAIETAKLFGIDITDKAITIDEILDAKGQYLPTMLNRLINSYTKIERKTFETSS